MASADLLTKAQENYDLLENDPSISREQFDRIQSIGDFMDALISENRVLAAQCLTVSNVIDTAKYALLKRGWDDAVEHLVTDPADRALAKASAPYSDDPLAP